MKKIAFALIPLTYLIILLFQQDLSMMSDLGRHLKMGQIVLSCMCVPQTNLFSYTDPNFPIVNHEWLVQVVFYVMSVWFGLHGLLILKMIIIIISFFLIYLVAIKQGSLFWTIIFSLLGLTIFSTRFFVLPELFSYLFIALFVFIIEKYKESKKYYLLWILPLIELVWVNSHIYFILGLGIYFFFILSELIKTKSINKSLIIIGITLILSTFINPSFIKGAILPFTFHSNYNFSVEENKSPFKILESSSTNTNLASTLILQIAVFDILFILFLACFFLKKNWKDPYFLGIGSMGFLLGTLFFRCISLFGILGSFALIKTFTEIEEKLKKEMSNLSIHALKGIIALIVASIIIFHVKGLFDNKILGFNFVPSAEKAVVFIKKVNLQGKIFNNYIIGNYLIYGLYPSEKVYIDARPEAYSGSIFDDYYRMMSDEKFFNQQVEKYDINAVVFNVSVDDPAVIRPFLLRLLQDSNWIPVYVDGTVTIIVRNNNANKKVIDTYKIEIPQN